MNHLNSHLGKLIFKSRACCVVSLVDTQETTTQIMIPCFSTSVNVRVSKFVTKIPSELLSQSLWGSHCFETAAFCCPQTARCRIRHLCPLPRFFFCFQLQFTFNIILYWFQVYSLVVRQSCTLHGVSFIFLVPNLSCFLCVYNC